MVRVIQYGTGNVGRHALRAIIERSDLELAGVRVFSPERWGVMPASSLGPGRWGSPPSVPSTRSSP